MSTQAVRIRPGLKDTARLVIAAAAWLVVFRLNGPFWDWLIYSALGLSPESAAGSALHFFGYDVVKITLLLVGIIFIVTVLRSFMSLERTRALLGGKREGAGNVMAAGLGVITPFCSCSAVPAFIGFVSAGVPIGVTMSFLIASPLVNEIAIGLLLGMFGLGPTLLYVAAGLTIAVVAGWILGRVHAERWVEPFVFQTTLRGEVVDDVSRLGWPDRVAMGREEVVSILRRIWPYFLVGIGVGAIIHGWVPVGFFTTYASADNPLGAHRRAPLLQRRRRHASGAVALHSGDSDGHSARLHDERGRPLGARADPAAADSEASPDRHLRRGAGTVHHRRRLPVQSRTRLGGTMLIKVLGPGCANCKRLEDRTREAVTDLGLDAQIEKVTDYAEIAGYGVMKTPGLVIDEKLVVSGRVPTTREITDLLTPA